MCRHGWAPCSATGCQTAVSTRHTSCSHQPWTWRRKTASSLPTRRGGVSLPAAAKRERPWLEPSVIEALADACPEPYGLAVRLMGYQGLRWGELAALKRRSVDLLNRRLVIDENVVEIGGVLT